MSVTILALQAKAKAKAMDRDSNKFNVLHKTILSHPSQDTDNITTPSELSEEEKAAEVRHCQSS